MKSDEICRNRFMGQVENQVERSKDQETTFGKSGVSITRRQSKTRDVEDSLTQGFNLFQLLQG